MQEKRKDIQDIAKRQVSSSEMQLVAYAGGECFQAEDARALIDARMRTRPVFWFASLRALQDP